ncbi:hypothetical protein B0H12DRAFT_1244465 [Mycena haematopus]|nr:hypothetical protein B0H12DRAFT_1244465 [Mycena haematopus]
MNPVLRYSAADAPRALPAAAGLLCPAPRPAHSVCRDDDPRSLLNRTDSGYPVLLPTSTRAVPPTSLAHHSPSPISVDLPPFASADADYCDHAGHSILTPATAGNTSNSTSPKPSKTSVLINMVPEREWGPPAATPIAPSLVPEPSRLPVRTIARPSAPALLPSPAPLGTRALGTRKGAGVENAPSTPTPSKPSAPARAPARTLSKSPALVPLLDPTVLVSLPPLTYTCTAHHCITCSRKRRRRRDVGHPHDVSTSRTRTAFVPMLLLY